MGFKNFAQSHNYQPLLNIDISGMDFAQLSDLYAENGTNAIYKIDGAYINKKSRFGSHPVIISTELNKLVDLPNHLTDAVVELLSDAESIADIKAGKAGFSIEKYIDKTYKKECYSVRWESLD